MQQTKVSGGSGNFSKGAKLCEDEDVNKTVMLLHTPNQDITVIVVTVKATCTYMEAEKP